MHSRLANLAIQIQYMSANTSCFLYFMFSVQDTADPMETLSGCQDAIPVMAV